MKTAVFPGSFDPVTIGHMDLIKRSAVIADRLIIGVLVNSSKTPLCSVDERVDMLKKLTGNINNIEVMSFDGLLVDFVDKIGAQIVIRGIRSSADFEYELSLAQANYKLNNSADTVFLATLPEYSYISSSAVKELIRYKGNIKGMVPDVVYQFLNAKFYF